MQNGKFTEEEKRYLISLPAVKAVRARQIVYSDSFKIETMEKYNSGIKPKKIFEEAGLSAELIGYKRIERSISRWKEASAKDSLCNFDAPVIAHKNHINTLKSQHKDAIKRQREIRDRRVGELREKMSKQKQKNKDRKDRTIEAQAAEIKKLKSQVKALKVLGTFAKKTKRAPKTTNKNERFQIIENLSNKYPDFCIKAACDILEVSRSGYYAFLKATSSRHDREIKDDKDANKIAEVFNYKNFKKGSRQIQKLLENQWQCKMNRKKIVRLMRKYNIVYRPKRKKPYYPIDADGESKIFPNLLDRNFKVGRPMNALLTDITYLKYNDGFAYLSAVKDAETCEIVAYKLSKSLQIKFVIDTIKQLKDVNFDNNAIIHSDMGSHYTSKSYRNAVKSLGLQQSMSRKGNCWDNAPMESYFGKMKDQLPDYGECRLIFKVNRTLK